MIRTERGEKNSHPTDGNHPITSKSRAGMRAVIGGHVACSAPSGKGLL